MKKLSFIMAVIMIVMTFPMMFMTSASAADVAADADAPATIESTDNVLHTYATDAEAIANNCIGRFTKAGGNGYAKTWAEVGANTGKAAIDKLTTFYLIADYEVKDGNNCIGRGTGAMNFQDRDLTIDGSLGTNRNFKIFSTSNQRILHYNDDAALTGTLTFQNLIIDSKDTGSTMQVNSGCTGFNMVIKNCEINSTVSTYAFCFRGKSLEVENCVINGNTAHKKCLMILDGTQATSVTLTNCVTSAGSVVVNNGNSSNKTLVLNNVRHDSKTGSSWSLFQFNNANTANNKLVINGGSYKGPSFGILLRQNWTVDVKDCTMTTGSYTFLANVDGDVYLTNTTLNIDGGVYTSNGQMFRSQTQKGLTTNIYDGVFVCNNLKDEPVAAGNGQSVGDKGMFYLSNCKALNIYGGSYTLYKDHGVTLCEKSPIILGWASGGVNTTVYGGKFTGGSCFFAKVKNDSNAKFDEAGSVFYGYGEGKNTINIAPEVVKGASIRLDAKSGLRFTSTIAANTINYLNAALVKAETELTYGTVITRASYLKYTGGEFTMEAFDKAGKNYVNVVAKDGVAKNADGSVTINAALVDIDAANYDKDFVAISYVKYTNANDEEVYLYATNFSLAENARNMEEVALAALADVKTKAEGAYTNAVSEYYVYNVAARKYELYTGTAYSVYTADQIKALQSYIVVEE